MTTAYTSLLGLALPVTGELSGTWGDTVNDYITQYLDASVAGTQTISGSQTAVTLSKTTNASLSQAGSGATGSSQYNVINCTGNPASMLTVTVPAASKTYVVVNATSTNQDVKIVGAGPTTGVTLVAGERAIIAWNGSDFIKVATSTVDGVSTIAFGTTGLTPSSATSGAVTVAGTLVAANGGTGQSSYTTGDLLYATGSTALSKLGIGTNGQILTSTGTAPQWSTLSGVAVTTFSAGTTGFTPSSATSGAVTLAGTLATTNGGTGLTSFTANGVVYASSSSALTTGSALTFDGTNIDLATVGAKVNFATTGSATRNYVGVSADGYSLEMVMQRGASQPLSYKQNFSVGHEWGIAGSGAMTLTSTGLGIGTSSPGALLHVSNPSAKIRVGLTASDQYLDIYRDNSTGYTIYNAAQAATFRGHIWQLGGSSAMTLDSSGNLGLGVTPSAWSASYKAISVGYAGGQQMAGGTANTQSLWTANLVFTGTGATGWKLPNNVAGTTYEQYLGAHKWYNAPANGVNGDATLTQAMTLSAGGNLLVGTTTQAASSAGRIVSAEASGGGIQIAHNNSGGGALYVALGGGGVATYTYTGAVGSESYTERARITSTGDVGIGTSSPTGRLTIYGGETHWGQSSSLGFLGTGGGNIPILGSLGALPLGFFTNATERMRLDSSGNLGLGVTPSAWGNGRVAFDVKSNGAVYSGTNMVGLAGNAYDDGSWKRKATAGATLYEASSQHAWYVTGSGSAGSTISWTQAMTLDASGRLLLGTTSAYYAASGRGEINLNASSDNIFGFLIGGNPYAYIYTSTSEFRLASATSIPTTFYTNNTERARITSDGNLLVGLTTTSYSAKLAVSGGIFTRSNQFNIEHSTSSSSNFEWVLRTGAGMDFYVNNSSVVASLSSSGVWTNASDARYKENIRPVIYGLAEVMQLQPRAYNIIGSDKQEIGFVAQEVEPLIPELVDSTRSSVTEEDRLTLSYGQMSAVLVKAIQEQQAIITELRQRVAALEAK